MIGTNYNKRKPTSPVFNDGKKSKSNPSSPNNLDNGDKIVNKAADLYYNSTQDTVPNADTVSPVSLASCVATPSPTPTLSTGTLKVTTAENHETSPVNLAPCVDTPAPKPTLSTGTLTVTTAENHATSPATANTESTSNTGSSLQ